MEERGAEGEEVLDLRGAKEVVEVEHHWIDREDLGRYDWLLGLGIEALERRECPWLSKAW